MNNKFDVSVEELKEFLKLENVAWHTYASSAGKVNKQLQIQVGGTAVRVQHNGVTVWTGFVMNIDLAVTVYNAIIK